MCEPLRLPDPAASVTVAELEVVSPQSMVAVWESFVPTSVNVAFTVAGAVVLMGDDTTGAPRTGATLATVTCALDVTGGLKGSCTLRVAVTIALSLQVTVGVRVVVPVGVQTVPGAPVVENDHEVCVGSPSGSKMAPCSVTGLPSTAA